MYVLGCFQNNECEVLDTKTPNASFQSLSARSLYQCDPVVCVVKSDVYLLGGDVDNYVQKYSTALDIWLVLPDLQHKIDPKNPCFVRGNTNNIYDRQGELLESYAI